ncbi:MAG: lipocalin-like domain-containing protein [Vicinamibacterales bacterium]
MHRHARFSLVVLAATVAWTAPGHGQTTLRSRLVGAWRLVGTEQVIDGQAPTPGAVTVGMLVYTADGHMQAQLTSTDRPKARMADAAPADLRAIARYTAYFGTFTVDEAAGTVTHHRDGTFGPGERDFVRSIDLRGTRLVLTTPSTVVDGKARYSRILWERLDAAPAAPGFRAGARQAVAGTWALVEHKTLLPGGEVRRSFGPAPKGLFFFLPDGYTAVQIVNPERPATALDRAGDDDVRALGRTYLAYFGRYDVDPATHKIVVHTTADLNPGNTGADQVRFFELAGDTLTLQPPPSARPGGGQQVSRITWRRVTGG